MDKKDIKSYTMQELATQLATLKLPAFRVKQIYVWLHKRMVTEFAQMTDISAQLRQQLGESYYINSFKIKRKLVSKIDGTIKYLFELLDGNCIEAVLMKYKHGNSLCISTQVGFRMGCNFCASTLGGLVRNLTQSEMLDEIYTATLDSGEKISSVVLMGIGEPLDNFDNVIKFFDIISSPDGLNLSLRHFSLSTCGLVDKINELKKLKLQLTLSISLHAPTDEIRNKTMPINNKYNIKQLIGCCKDYFEYTGRRVSFEYSLIGGVNDSIACANQLADLLRGMICHVNLIPVNEVKERGYKKGTKQSVEQFKNALEKRGINATVRRELGSDINAACGQLRREDNISKN